ncbi:hypothetical protein BDQ12DRAFT_691759 [Crucibulum laeve]|uniref:Uncharacterized protein n=1 Tax=Crucibulum laeve TaxID=68775 RepID=A0A5C3LWC6_9AGAR|nr:hypothetical protein BDQ12DRAFT_691759 [Crucibulum laeve]
MVSGQYLTSECPSHGDQTFHKHIAAGSVHAILSSALCLVAVQLKNPTYRRLSPLARRPGCFLAIQTRERSEQVVDLEQAERKQN